jgi:hypothetical protein
VTAKAVEDELQFESYDIVATQETGPAPGGEFTMIDQHLVAVSSFTGTVHWDVVPVGQGELGEVRRLFQDKFRRWMAEHPGVRAVIGAPRT